MEEKEIAAVKVVEEFLRDELEDYYTFEGWKITSTEEYAGNVYINAEAPHNGWSFKVDKDGKLYIDMHEDAWQQLVTYDWRVKYFWMEVNWS